MEGSSTNTSPKKHQRLQSKVESNTGMNYIPINPETGKRFTMQEAYGPARIFVEDPLIFDPGEDPATTTKSSEASSAVASSNMGGGEGQPPGTFKPNEPRQQEPASQFAPEDSEEHPSLEKEIRAAAPLVTDEATLQHARVVSEIEAVVSEVPPR